MWGFNPRSREGNDTGIPLRDIRNERFNPRSREGNDAINEVTTRLVDGFNPRSREGNDSNYLQFLFIVLAHIYAIIPIHPAQCKFYHP